MSQVVVQSLTGITDVIGVTKQLRALEERYGSLRQSPVPSPSTWNHIPFLMKRIPREIARPMMNTDGGYARTTAYPIVITEDPEWLKFWQEATQKAMILEMVNNGQAGLLQESDRKILQEMQSISLPMAKPQSLPVIDTPVPAISSAPQPALEPADEPTVDTAAVADEDAAAEYREGLLTRAPKERCGAVNVHLKLAEEELNDIWARVDQTQDGIERTTEFIHLMLIHYAEGHMVKQVDANKLIESLQGDLGLIDEGLAEMFVAELPNHVAPAAKEQPTTFAGVSID